MIGDAVAPRHDRRLRSSTATGSRARSTARTRRCRCRSSVSGGCGATSTNDDFERQLLQASDVPPSRRPRSVREDRRPVKQVAALDDEFELRDDGRGVDPDFVEWELNEWDKFSLEAALQLRDAARARARSSSSRSATRRPRRRCARAWPRAPTARSASGTTRWRRRRAARWRGCWRRRGARGARPRALRRAVLRRRATAPPGSRSRAISACRAWRWSRRIDYDDGGGSATVERELEGGLVEVCGCARPALLTVQTGINEPRYATLRAIKQAEAKPLERASSPATSASTRPRWRRAAGSRFAASGTRREGRGRRDARGRPRPRSRGRDRGDRQGEGGG